MLLGDDDFLSIKKKKLESKNFFFKYEIEGVHLFDSYKFEFILEKTE